MTFFILFLKTLVVFHGAFVSFLMLEGCPVYCYWMEKTIESNLHNVSKIMSFLNNYYFDEQSHVEPRNRKYLCLETSSFLALCLIMNSF